MRKFLLVLLLAAIAAVALALAFVPKLALTPDKNHDPGDIARAFQLAKVAPIGTVALALGALVLAVIIWRKPRKSGWLPAVAWTILLLLLVAPTLFAAAFTRVDIYARMFPSIDVDVVRTADAAEIEDDALVMGVAIGDESRAYPIAIVGYHHIIHDEVGDRAIVATY